MNEGKTLGELQADVLGLEDDLKYMIKAYDSAVTESGNLRDKIWKLEEEVTDLKAEAELTEKLIRDSVRDFENIIYDLRTWQ